MVPKIWQSLTIGEANYSVPLLPPFKKSLLTFYACCCMTKRSLGKCDTHIYSPQIRNSWQTKVWTPPKSYMLNQWVLSELLRGEEMTQKQLYFWGPLTPTCVTAHTSWETRAHCTCWQFTRLESVLSKWLWSKPLPGSLVGFCCS